MADLSDVLTSLVQLLNQSLYPVQPPVAGQSIVGADVIIGKGWPTERDLQRAIAARQCVLAVYPIDGDRIGTLEELTEEEVPRPAPGISATLDAAGLRLTLAGRTAPADVLGLVMGGHGYTVNFPALLDPAGAAAQVITALPPGAATLDGADVVFTNADPYRQVIVSNNGEVLTAYETVEKRIQIHLWAFDQVRRDAVFRAISVAVAKTSFMHVPQQGGAYTEAVRLKYLSSPWSDKSQNAGAYIRDLIVSVEFSISDTDTAYAILFPGLRLNGRDTGTTPPDGT